MSDKEIKAKVELELNKAESVWNQVSQEFFEKARNFSALNESIPTLIPGFPFIKSGEPKVGQFIALVLDVRSSTKHLTEAISARTAKASQLERVLYEMTAINTAGSIIIEDYKGGITEFLGDGFLSLFQAEEKKNVYGAYNAAKKCLRVLDDVVNPVLNERYSLPPLRIGIGMAYSKAIVTVVGTENNLHPKAIGECVYRASKLSGGTNEVYVDDALKFFWPKDDDGTLKFFSVSLPGALKFKGYKVG